MVASRSSTHSCSSKRGEVPIHLLIDPGSDGVVIGVFESAADAVFTAEGVDAGRAGHDGVAAEGGDAGVAALAGEDGVDHRVEDLVFVGGVRALVSEGAGVDKLGPGVTGFEKVNEVSDEAVAGDGGGGFRVHFDGAAEGVDAVGRREAGGGGRVFTLWVNGRKGVDRANPVSYQSARSKTARPAGGNCRIRVNREPDGGMSKFRRA
jgi:hypothetical protein